MRRAALAFALALAACGTEEPAADSPPASTRPATCNVTYSVALPATTAAEVVYGVVYANESNAANEESGIAIPWERTVAVPYGTPATFAATCRGPAGESLCKLAARVDVQRVDTKGWTQIARETVERPVEGLRLEMAPLALCAD